MVGEPLRQEADPDGARCCPGNAAQRGQRGSQARAQAVKRSDVLDYQKLAPTVSQTVPSGIWTDRHPPSDAARRLAQVISDLATQDEDGRKPKLTSHQIKEMICRCNERAGA